MENFLEIASDNTKKDIETCGVLGAIIVRSLVFILLSWWYFKIIFEWWVTPSALDFAFTMTGYGNFKWWIVECQTCKFLINMFWSIWHQTFSLLNMENDMTQRIHFSKFVPFEVVLVLWAKDYWSSPSLLDYHIPSIRIQARAHSSVE